MKFKVVRTTDGKHIGQIYEVDDLEPSTVLSAAGMRVEEVVVEGDLIHLINSNYRVTIKGVV